MNLRKGLTLITIGFLITHLEISLSFRGAKLNIIPDFVGWILMFLAIDYLGDYARKRLYLKGLSLILIIAHFAFWIIDFLRPAFDYSILKVIVAVLYLLYIFALFTVLGEISHDFGSERETTIRNLKVLNAMVYITTLVLSVLKNWISLQKISLVVIILGITALVSSIITVVIMFKLRNEVSGKTN